MTCSTGISHSFKMNFCCKEEASLMVPARCFSMFTYCGKEGHDEEDKSDPDLCLCEGRVVALELKTQTGLLYKNTPHRCF